MTDFGLDSSDGLAMSSPTSKRPPRLVRSVVFTPVFIVAATLVYGLVAIVVAISLSWSWLHSK